MFNVRAVLAMTFREKDDKTLLIHRTNKPKVWSPPGGFLQDTIKLTTLDEIEEETGLEVLSYLGKLGIMDGDIAITGVLVKNGQLHSNSNEWDGIGWFDVKNVNNLSPSKDNIYWGQAKAKKNFASLKVHEGEDNGCGNGNL